MKIKLDKIKLFGYHGVYESENDNGQFFNISITLKLDIDLKTINDDIKNTLDYSQLYKIVKNQFYKTKYNLLESLIVNIKDSILNSDQFSTNKYTIKNLKVSISKTGEHFDGDIDTFEITS